MYKIILFSEWQSVPEIYNQYIPYDIQSLPLQVITTSLMGSGDHISIDFDNYYVYIGLRETNKIYFSIQHCVKIDVEYEKIIPPDQPTTIWEFEKTSTSLLITINGTKLLEIDFADYGKYCKTVWETEKEWIMFLSYYDTASQSYKKGINRGKSF